MEDVRTDDLEELADSLEETVPPAPEMPPPSITEPQRSPEGAEKIQRLKSQEELLLRADRLLISDGARLVLFLPLMVIVLYGLAQTFTASNPQWWTDHIEAIVEGLGMSTGIYGMSLLMLVADTALLLILLRLMVLTRAIFRLEAKELTTIGLTFNSAHGYAEMRATIDGAIRQLGITILLMAMAAALLAASL
ncbi:uncharacterized protein METZ01_LOCUS510552, partial [marine metagenome]